MKGLFSRVGLVGTLAHLARLGDEAATVDFLNGVSGLGFPRWPDCSDLTWCAMLSPMLVRLLQSHFEEYVSHKRVCRLGVTQAVLEHDLIPRHSA